MRSRFFIGIMASALLALCGCGAQRERERLNSLNARDRALAAIRLADARDGESVHRLVPLLQDADSAVRMYAILSLERLTGETFGYRYFDAEVQRSAAVDRWRLALSEGRVQLRSAGLTTPAPSRTQPASQPAAAPTAGEISAVPAAQAR